MPRFFLTENETVGEKTILCRSGENYNHIARALRMRVGESVTFCDGNGNDFFCQIGDITAQQISLQIDHSAPSQGELPLHITLFQCLAKGDKMEQIIKRSVEMGVCEIVPVCSQNCVVRAKVGDTSKTERWQKIARSAAEQSGRGRIPIVTPVISIQQAITRLQQMDVGFVCYEQEKQTTLLDIPLPTTGHIGFLIGPEGGLAPAECEAWQTAGIAAITLGERILRTENAATYVLPILSYKMEEKMRGAL